VMLWTDAQAVAAQRDHSANERLALVRYLESHTGRGCAPPERRTLMDEPGPLVAVSCAPDLVAELVVR
jgi:hypothetical protein